MTHRTAKTLLPRADVTLHGDVDEAKEQGKDLSQHRYNAAVMGGVLKCVEDHDLKGVPKPLTADNFPASPGASSMRLSAWLIKEVADVYTAEDEDPNE